MVSFTGLKYEPHRDARADLTDLGRGHPAVGVLYGRRTFSVFTLSEHKKNPDRLSDHLPWAMLVAPGVVFNKNGSFQTTFAFRGPDLESATEAELVITSSQINNTFKRLTGGWALYADAHRRRAGELSGVPPGRMRSLTSSMRSGGCSFRAIPTTTALADPQRRVFAGPWMSPTPWRGGFTRGAMRSRARTRMCSSTSPRHAMTSPICSPACSKRSGRSRTMRPARTCTPACHRRHIREGALCADVSR